MKYNPDIHRRHSVRLKDFDYSSNGMYFITVCTQDREKFFGSVVGADSISARVELNSAGMMINEIWRQTLIEFRGITAEKHVVMPNHFHCLLSISRADIESAPTVSTIIQSFKRNTTVKYIHGVKTGICPPFNKRIWQRSYYEHIIRNEEEYFRIRAYIEENPAKWCEDEYFA